MPRFKSIIFYQYSPNTKLFLKKNAKFSSAGGKAPRPCASGGWGLCPQTPNSLWQLGALPPDPQNSPFKLRISGYASTTLGTVENHMGFHSFCFEQFFLHRSVANLMMLTIIDVCLMLNCFLFESFICITHCVTLIPSCYIALSYLFAKA